MAPRLSTGRIFALNRTYKLIFGYFLRNYRRSGALAVQKARMQLQLLITSFAVMQIFIINGYLTEGRLPDYALPLLPGMVLLAVLAFVLRRGHYLVSGHLFLGLLFLLIWNDMFFESASHPITRLDTTVLLLTVLLMVPLFTNRHGLLIHFSINLMILLIFVNNNPAAPEMNPRTVTAFATDAIVAFVATGIIAWLLVATTARARRRVERAHRQLEATVRLRTNALRQTTEELRFSRDEMQNDLEMARKVQENIIPATPPRLASWDLALYYRPVAAVSGDFFDFYQEGERLTGVSLFDVSGHGVSSGLITILARSLLHRHVREAPADTPADILERANMELVDELRDAFYFLSGVMLRIDGDRIQLASAGHPEVLIAREDGVTSGFAGAEASTPHRSGNLMGIAALAESYPMVETRVFPGDTLLLYTDALIESTNEDRDDFGANRLQRAFDESRQFASAEDRLAHVIRDLNDFMGGTPLTDDLTVIVMRKK